MLCKNALRQRLRRITLIIKLFRPHKIFAIVLLLYTVAIYKLSRVNRIPLSQLTPGHRARIILHYYSSAIAQRSIKRGRGATFNIIQRSCLIKTTCPLVYYIPLLEKQAHIIDKSLINIQFNKRDARVDFHRVDVIYIRGALGASVWPPPPPHYIYYI